MKRAALIAALAAGPAWATPGYVLPTLFDVTGVAAGDVLNIRAAPDANAAIVGAIAPDATGIEVVAEHSGWGQVNTGERSGWASLAYLAYRTDVWESGTLPAGLACFGTEPFWSLRPEGAMATFGTPDAADVTLDLAAVLDTGIFRDLRRALVAEAPGRRITATIAPKACSDGMSDRAFGLDATLIVERPDGTRLLTGCCSIRR
jgi:uncharacterized membrane protein